MAKNNSANGDAPEKIGDIVSIHLRGSVWHVVYQHAGKQNRKSLKTRSKKEARRRALFIERDVLAGQHVAERRPPLIVEVAADFRAAKVGEGLAPKTLQKYDHCIRLLNELAGELQISRIDQVSPRFMEKFRSRRVEKLSKKPGRDGQKTATNDLVTIREIVNYALARKVIHVDPLDGYSVKKAKSKPQPYWVQEELERILAAAKRQPHQDLFRLLAWTGMRIGEVQYLTWDDVDFDNKVIKVQAKRDWKPKTGDARSIPMASEVIELLKRQPRRSEWVFSFPTDQRGPARQVRQRRLLDYLQRRLRELGLRGHLHTFRHTFISLALTRGTAEATVRRWVGHVDAEILRRYTHIASEESRAAMQRLEASIQERRSRS